MLKNLLAAAKIILSALMAVAFALSLFAIARTAWSISQATAPATKPAPVCTTLKDALHALR